MARPLAAILLGSLSSLAFAGPAMAQPVNLLPPSAPPAVPVVAAAPPSPPPVTYALLPGHWELRGWRYVWAPPETVPRRVEDRPLVLGHYVWQGGRWEWVPAHYAPN